MCLSLFAFCISQTETPLLCFIITPCAFLSFSFSEIEKGISCLFSILTFALFKPAPLLEFLVFVKLQQLSLCEDDSDIDLPFVCCFTISWSFVRAHRSR